MYMLVDSVLFAHAIINYVLYSILHSNDGISRKMAPPERTLLLNSTIIQINHSDLISQWSLNLGLVETYAVLTHNL